MARRAWAEDVRRYGRWMRDEAEKRIGHLYPKVEVTWEMVSQRPDLKPYEGRKLTVIAWLWARTVRSPNPAFADVEVPLVSTFMLSTKKGKEAYVEPVIEGRNYRFEVKAGKPPDPEAAKQGTNRCQGQCELPMCLMSGVHTYGMAIYIKTRRVCQSGWRMRVRLMAVVMHRGIGGGVYLVSASRRMWKSLAAGDFEVGCRARYAASRNDPRDDHGVRYYGLTTFS